MNEKKARLLRKKAGYDISDDPAADRRYANVICKQVIGRVTEKSPPRTIKTGNMNVCKENRGIYKLLKKAYKEGKYEPKQNTD